MTATTRDRIVDAALGIVAERGLSDVTMVDIARAAGVARATLYNHYPDVASIMTDAVARHDDEAIAGLRRSLAVVASPTETIAQLVRHVAAISTHGHTLTTPHHLAPELRSAFDDELRRELAETLAAGKATGEFRADLDDDTTATLVRHLLDGVSELVAESPRDAARIVEQALEMVLTTITVGRDG